MFPGDCFESIFGISPSSKSTWKCQSKTLAPCSNYRKQLESFLSTAVVQERWVAVVYTCPVDVFRGLAAAQVTAPFGPPRGPLGGADGVVKGSSEGHENRPRATGKSQGSGDFASLFWGGVLNPGGPKRCFVLSISFGVVPSLVFSLP